GVPIIHGDIKKHVIIVYIDRDGMVRDTVLYEKIISKNSEFEISSDERKIEEAQLDAKYLTSAFDPIKDARRIIAAYAMKYGNSATRILGLATAMRAIEKLRKKSISVTREVLSALRKLRVIAELYDKNSEIIEIKKHEYPLEFLLGYINGTILSIREKYSLECNAEVISLNPFLIRISSEAQESETRAVVVHSTKKSALHAAVEIAGKIKQEIKSPDWIFLTATPTYPLEELVAKIHNAFNGKVKIHGLTSCFGVITNEGLIVGPDNHSVAALAVKSKHIRFGVGHSTSVSNAGIIALEEAIKSAGMSPNATPSLIIISSVPGMEERILEDIRNAVGKVPAYGGTAADNDFSGKWRVICNDKVISGVVITAIFTKTKIGMAHLSGYPSDAHSGVVTKSIGRVIHEIDGKPAAEVFMKWVEKKFSDLKDSGGLILDPASYVPLAYKITNNKKEFWVVAHPTKCNKDGSIELLTEVQEGAEVWLLDGNENTLLNRPRFLVDLCMQKIKATPLQLDFGIMVCCAANMLPIKEKFSNSLNEALNAAGVPIIGAFTFGEQVHIPKKIECHHGNMTSWLLLFKKKRKHLAKIKGGIRSFCDEINSKIERARHIGKKE
ncbi:MAG: FIST N-terminal domain-containing protein, partial [Candidatus Korarchaeota archaeon]